MRVLIFARVSKDSSGIGRSVEEQVADGKAWADAEGWTVVEVIRETGSASAFSSRTSRAEWDRAIERIRDGNIDALLTWENSRATRDLNGYLALRKECFTHNVKWGYGRRLYDLSQRDDRFRTALDALLAEDEAARISERILRAVNANAADGKPHGKNLYGYRRVYDQETKLLVRVEPDPATAPIVAEAARRVLAGESLYSIARDFNLRGIPTRRPKRADRREGAGWTGPAIKQMLSTPAYAGLRQHRGEIIGNALWPAIIDPDAWSEVQGALFRPDRRRVSPWKVTHLLTGIARCSMEGCRGRMRVSRNSARVLVNGTPTLRHYRNYQCEAQLHTSIAQKYLDAIVVENVLQRIERTDFTQLLAAGNDEVSLERQAILDEIAGHQRWLEDVRRRAEAERNLELLFDQEARVQPRIKDAMRRLERLSQISGSTAEVLAHAGDIRSVWPTLPLHTRRLVISELVDVVIHPAARRGARGVQQAIDRTQITWRFDV